MLASLLSLPIQALPQVLCSKGEKLSSTNQVSDEEGAERALQPNITGKISAFGDSGLHTAVSTLSASSQPPLVVVESLVFMGSIGHPT